MLPVPYFHVVVTVAEELNTVIRYNRALLYDLLFRESAGALKQFGRDPRWLGGEIGLIGVLHTWGQMLQFHPHIHYIVPQGGIDAQGRWIEPKWKGRFLFPAPALSAVFKARFLKALRRLYEADKLSFPDAVAQEQFSRVLVQAAAKKWQLFVKRPFKGPHRIVQYLGAYTHKIAISPGRILSVDQEQVHFAYKDYRHGGKNKSGHLSGVEFVRRFSGHVLPARFRRICQYGFLLRAKAKKGSRGCKASSNSWPPAWLLYANHPKVNWPMTGPHGSAAHLAIKRK